MAMVTEPTAASRDASSAQVKCRFDSVFKDLSWNSAVLPVALLGDGVAVRRHISIELPDLPKRAGYCVELANGAILHGEFATAADPILAWRMLSIGSCCAGSSRLTR